jgi:hypothetical protein
VDRAVDPDKHLIQVPLVTRSGPPTAQLVGVGLPELGAPAPDRFVTDHDTALQHQFLDVAEAEREPVVQPHAVVDDLARVAVALVRRLCGAHDQDPASHPRQPINVTMPGPVTIAHRTAERLY